MNQAKKLTHKDLNCTENEFSDFLLDCWKIAKNLENGTRINIVVGNDEIVTFAFVNDHSEVITLN